MLNHSRLTNLITYLFSLLLLIYVGCDDDLDDQSLVTGDCEFNDVITIFTPNPVSLYPGETVEVEAEVTIFSNCTDFAKQVYVYRPDPTCTPPLCGTCSNTIINGMAICSKFVSISESAQPGIRNIIYKTSVSSEDNFGGTIKSVIDTLVVNVLGQIDDFNVHIPGPFEVREGTTANMGGVSVDRSPGHNENITLSIINLPEYIEYSFDPNPVTTNDNISMLTLIIDYPAVVGDYTPSIVGTDESNIVNEFAFDLSIKDQYTINFYPDTISVLQGELDTVDLIVQWGYSEVYNEMIFTLEGGILGQGDEFIEAIIKTNPLPWGVFVTYVFLNVGELVPPDTYTITASGATTNLEKFNTLQITVTQ